MRQTLNKEMRGWLKDYDADVTLREMTQQFADEFVLPYDEAYALVMQWSRTQVRPSPAA